MRKLNTVKFMNVIDVIRYQFCTFPKVRTRLSNYL